MMICDGEFYQVTDCLSCGKKVEKYGQTGHCNECLKKNPSAREELREWRNSRKCVGCKKVLKKNPFDLYCDKCLKLPTIRKAIEETLKTVKAAQILARGVRIPGKPAGKKETQAAIKILMEAGIYRPNINLHVKIHEAASTNLFAIIQMFYRRGLLSISIRSLRRLYLHQDKTSPQRG